MNNYDSRIEKAAQGNRLACNSLYFEFKDRIFNTILNILHDKEDAEDILQETFAEVFKSLSSFHGDSSLQTWIYRIAVNKTTEFIRRKNAKKRWSLFSFSNAEVENVNDVSFHPGIRLDKREEAASLYKAIGKLKENQRIAFTLFFIEDFSQKEIAEMMDTSVANVESLVFRAKKSLKKELDKIFV